SARGRRRAGGPARPPPGAGAPCRTSSSAGLVFRRLGGVGRGLGGLFVFEVAGGGTGHGGAEFLRGDGRGVGVRDQLAVVDDAEGVGQADQLVEVGRDQQDGQSLAAGLADVVPDRGLRADVHTAGGVRGDQEARLVAHLAADDQLLLVAAGQGGR